MRYDAAMTALYGLLTFVCAAGCAYGIYVLGPVFAAGVFGGAMTFHIWYRFTHGCWFGQEIPGRPEFYDDYGLS